MTLEQLEVWLEPETLAELRHDAAARGISPAELAREAIEAFVDVERAAVLDPDELEKTDEELLHDEEDSWPSLGGERWLPDDPDEDY